MDADHAEKVEKAEKTFLSTEKAEKVREKMRNADPIEDDDVDDLVKGIVEETGLDRPLVEEMVEVYRHDYMGTDHRKVRKIDKFSQSMEDYLVREIDPEEMKLNEVEKKFNSAFRGSEVTPITGTTLRDYRREIIEKRRS